MLKKIITTLLLSILFCCCERNKDRTLFSLLDERDTGIDFSNTITESDTFNILAFEYIYNGAGVGVGDVNNDGLQDIFFAGNMVTSELYLNRGNLRFDNVTQESGISTRSWCTGVAMIDINHDGWLDIHVATVHPDKEKSSPNLFFLNKGLNDEGIPVFDEIASQLGLADTSYSTQAAFLDYDLDGDMDMFLLNNALENYNRNIPMGQRKDGLGKSIDKLYRNDGNGNNGFPIFTDVSKEAGILPEGWGLGIVVNDFNGDGYPDIYITNDFISSDNLFINNRNGTFTDRIGEYFKHEESNGMGVDAADINNDGLNDIVAVDMLPDDNLRQKTMFSNIGYDRFQLTLSRKYQPQYVRNVLQLNNGNGSFSDIGYLAGISATDWSWSSLLADFDNDGYKDLLITNGYRKDVTDLDFATYSKGSNMFGTSDIKLKKAMEAVNELVGVKKHNFIFRNNANLTFSDKATEWGFDQPSYTNGAAYVDLDNDGDLDLVMNNINDKAFIYRNNLESTTTHYLRVKLEGNNGNTMGIGAKLTLYHGGKKQFIEHELQRGYKSSVEPLVHFGLGSTNNIDSLIIIWPSRLTEVLKNVHVDQTIVLNEGNASEQHAAAQKDENKIFSEVHADYKINFKQREQDFVDYKQGQASLPQKYSQLGPGIATGDINGDGLEDFIVGAPAGEKATIFYQSADNAFIKDYLPSKIQEDMGLLLFDADNDGDLDLYCVSGSSEFNRDSTKYQDRFYRNDGKGHFLMDTKALPTIFSSGSCVTACDYDKDGDLDLFVGGRIRPLEYPYPPKSYLLINDGKGLFTEGTKEFAPDLQQVGMITSSIWSDFDNDSWVDLIVVGEWMPITFFKNKHGRLSKHITSSPKPESITGWWNSIQGGDFDNDGDIDYVAGNVGLNSIYQTSENEPVCIYAKDFDQNGSIDPILCRFIQGEEFVTHPRETLTDQMVSMRRPFQRYSTYGKSTFKDIFPSESLKGALIYKGTWFSSTYIENIGDGNFKVKSLPVEVQVSPVFGIAINDYNNDGNLDVLTVGNSYSSETLTGFYDAGIGSYLKGDGNGNFEFMPVVKSGFFVDNDAKALSEIVLSHHNPAMLATVNQDSMKVFTRTISKQIPVKIKANDVFAEISFADGKRRKIEFYYGSGYLSQSSRYLWINDQVKEVFITNNIGTKRKITL